MEQADMRADLVITGPAQLLTCAPDAADHVGLLTRGPLDRDDFGVAISGDRIVAVGDVSGYEATRRIDASGMVVMPGFVDSHTHLVFGGDRSAEYAAKVAGLEPPPGAVVGITGTMSATRDLPVEVLVAEARPRIDQMISSGTTTVEVKTGYGLSLDSEWRMLQANEVLRSAYGIDIVSTYLGGHGIAPGRDPDEWTREIIGQLPAVAEAGLARFNDVYCDVGYFSEEQTRAILAAGVEVGLQAKIHLDAYSHTGAAALTAELGAVSADHLNFTDEAELARLAEAGVTGVYMPCLEYSVNHQNPLDPRRVRDAGVELAIATDLCPGCWATSMETVIAMACRTGGLSVPEAIRAATLGGAKALGLGEETGALVPGRRADVIVVDVPSHEHLAYRLSGGNVRTVIASGRVVSERAPSATGGAETSGETP